MPAFIVVLDRSFPHKTFAELVLTLWLEVLHVPNVLREHMVAAVRLILQLVLGSVWQVIIVLLGRFPLLRSNVPLVHSVLLDRVLPHLA